MTDWVHCNACFRQPGGASKFYLTSCGHMYCNDCLKEGTTGKCKMCGNKCNMIPLTAQMKPDVEIFFTDPLEISRRHYKQLNTVIDFQKNHRSRLTAYWREKNAKNSSVMEDAKKKMGNQLMELERYNKQLQEENNKLRSLVAGGTGVAGHGPPRRHGTPVSRPLHSSSSLVTYAMRVAAQGYSPQQMRSLSPYGRRPGQSKSHGPGGETCTTLQVRCTPPGPARLSIRTPPVNGRIGTVSTPTSSGNSLSLTPHGSLQLVRSRVKTPGLHEAVAGASSPIIQSPASSRSDRYYSASQPAPSSYANGPCSSSSLSQPSSDSAHRKQIQLNHIPQTPLISAPGSSHN